MVSGLGTLKLTGVTTATTYAADSVIKQTVGVGSTIGFVASWDKTTGVLKYYQPTGLASSVSLDLELFPLRLHLMLDME